MRKNKYLTQLLEEKGKIRHETFRMKFTKEEYS